MAGQGLHRAFALIARGPHVFVDQVLAMTVHERRDRPLIEVVQPAPTSGKPCAVKSLTGGEKSSLPLNQGLTVC